MNGSTPRGELTRNRILDEAIRAFDSRGYNGASLRAIAAAANVDLALLPYYFGNKEGLFGASVFAALEPLRQIPLLVAADPEAAPVKIADLVLELIGDNAGKASVRGLLRTLLTPDYPVDAVRDKTAAHVHEMLIEAIGGQDAPTDYALILAEILGVLICRDLIKLEPLASAPESVVRAYLVERLRGILVSPVELGLVG